MSAAMKSLTPEQTAWRWKILISTYLAYAGYYLVRKTFTVCKSTLAENDAFDFGYDGVALIWATYLVAYMVGQFINSFVGRKYGPRVLLLGGLGLSMGINIVFAFSSSLWLFVAFMAFNGLVQAAGWPGAVGGVAHWIRKKERGVFMGFWSTNYALGNAIVKTLAAMILGYYAATNPAIGVRNAFLGMTLLAFVVWWVIYFWQRDKPEDVGLPHIVDPDEDDKDSSVDASREDHVTFKQYMVLLLSPIVLLMGAAYFCIKTLRYALDSWLPTFLDLQGMDVAQAGFYSSIFDYAGLLGAIGAGIALDKVFKGRWERVTLVMGIGMVLGYLLVVKFGANPVFLAVSFGVVGFMLYGPDQLLSGAGAIIVAGESNGVAVAGIVNGIGSIGPVIQELVIGQLLERLEPQEAIRVVNLLGLGMAVAFVVIMPVICIQANRIRARKLADSAV